MKRVLQVFGEPLDNGGQEAFIMNIYRNIDREQVQFDFFTPYYCANENLRKEIEDLGGRVFEKGGRFDTEGNKSDFLENLGAFFKEHSYETVHIHSGSIFSLAFGARLAKKHGAKKVLVHSHATGLNNLKYKVIKAASPFIFKGNATHYLACSEIAARWKFPASIIKKGRYTVINNGIDLDNFTFSAEKRAEYREMLGLGEDLVLCHIGRFSEEKNHAFILEVFAKLLQKQQNSRLLLVGDGLLKAQIEEQAASLGIKERISFLGHRKDISEILQASDRFIFPSIFEGLGIVAIEAQATGLMVLASEEIPEEAAAIDSLFHRASLAMGAEIWAEKLLSLSPAPDRAIFASQLRERGFASNDVAAILQQIYLEG